MNRIWILLLLLCSLVGCDKTEYKLEGKWQVEQIEYADGTVIVTDTLYYNFQNHLFSVQWYTPAVNAYNARGGYVIREDDKTMELVLATEGELGLLEGETPAIINWKDMRRVFTIEKLTRTRLVLSGDGEIYTMHSF